MAEIETEQQQIQKWNQLLSQDMSLEKALDLTNVDELVANMLKNRSKDVTSSMPINPRQINEYIQKAKEITKKKPQ